MRKTIRRDWLQRQIAKGTVFMRCRYHYTDDYAWDAATNFGKDDEWWKPTEKTFDNWDFRTSTGYCYRNNDGTITFAIHSNLAYDVKIVA